MLDFYTELKNLKREDLLHKLNHKPVHFINEQVVFNYLDDMREHSEEPVYLIGDPDVDGLMCLLAIRDSLIAMGMKNVMVQPYYSRSHSVEQESVLACIQLHSKYCIISDTGSSSLNLLKQLQQYGIKTLVLDHHQTKLDYSDFPCPIINTMIENRSNNNKFALSAGALCFCVFETYFSMRNLEFPNHLKSYALISLYSDCMDMSNVLNREIYWLAANMDRTILPLYVQHFMNDYQAFNSRFIGFWLAPRINALFRTENFDTLNTYFFQSAFLDVEKRNALIQKIERIYSSSRAEVALASDLVDINLLQNFVLCDLSSVFSKTDKTFLNIQNYTGLIANKLAERYGKTAITYIRYENAYKASLRDQYGRNYLNMFQQMCHAGGHNAAFGMKINLLEMQDFLLMLDYIDKNYAITAIDNEPIIVPYQYNQPDFCLIEDMALYNEFSGTNVPVALLAKQLVGMKEYVTQYNFKYAWGEYFIQSQSKLDIGTKMILKPIRSGTTKLIYQQ